MSPLDVFLVVVYCLEMAGVVALIVWMAVTLAEMLAGDER